MIYLNESKREKYKDKICIKGDIYCMKVLPFWQTVEFLVINRINTDECRININMDDKAEKIRRQAKVKEIFKELKMLGYKKIIVDNENYDYIKDMIKRYNVKSLENENGFLLEI